MDFGPVRYKSIDIILGSLDQTWSSQDLGLGLDSRDRILKVLVLVLKLRLGLGLGIVFYQLNNDWT